MTTRPAYALFDWWLRFAVWLLAFLLFAWALSSCSMLGIATEGYVETRVDDVNQHTAKAAGKVAETFETVAPGISSYVEDVFLNEPTNPPPAPVAGCHRHRGRGVRRVGARCGEGDEPDSRQQPAQVR